MQGDIFQLEDVLNKQHMESNSKPTNTTATTTTTEPKTKPQVTVKQLTTGVSIYNEDHPSHYLFQGTKAFDDAELGKAFSQAHYLDVIASTFDDYCPETPTWHSSDEFAISSDDDDADEDHHGHEEHDKPAATGFKNETVPMPITLTKKRGSDTTTHARRLAMSESPRENEARKAAEAVAVPVTMHVSRIRGPLMSWWPTPVEYQKHEWNERFYE